MHNPSIQPKITITGDLGSGKSVTSKFLSQALSYEIYSAGKVQREIAARYGMTTLELNQYAETHPEIDEEIDSVFVQLNERPEGLIVDSRMAWFFMPDSFKIYLTVPPRISAERIMGDASRNKEKYRDLDHAIRDITARKASENRRFLEIYQADCANHANFDLVVNTSEIAPKEVGQQILRAFRAWAASR
ncbi:MAG: (d)CMP kinase [Bacteroidota bacterium]